MLQSAVTLAIVQYEPTLVFWKIEDLREALAAAHDMGLPLTSPPDVADEFIAAVRRFLLEDPDSV